jgi:cobalt-zinc-cadmium efflux system outer membrane protein
MRTSRASVALLGCLLSVPLFAAPAEQAEPQLYDPSAPRQAITPSQNAIEPAGALTLAAALELAEQSSPELAAARRELAAVDALIDQARIRPNPILSATYDEIGSDAPVTELALSQEIELGGKRSARIEAAERARDVATADFEGTRMRLRSEVTAAFFDVLTAQERLALAQTSAELAQRAANAAARRVAAGKVSPVEETRAQVAAAGVQVELTQAEAALELARRQLSAIWGNSEPRFARAAEAAQMLPTAPALADLYERLTDSALLARARLETERRRATLELERAQRVPNLTVSAGAQHSEAFDSTQAVVSVAIPLPLFDRNQGNIGAAQQRLYQAQDEQAAAEVRLKRELAQAHALLTAASRQAQTLRENVLPGAQRAFEAATKGFELGKFDFLDVLDAQRTLLQARTQYLGALAQGTQAGAELARILGDGAVDFAPAGKP